MVQDRGQLLGNIPTMRGPTDLMHLLTRAERLLARRLASTLEAERCSMDAWRVVTVLADTAIRGHDLDEAKATEAKRLAEEALVNKESEIDYAKAQAELASAVAQLAAIERLRKKR